jgi:hypothetical protein
MKHVLQGDDGWSGWASGRDGAKLCDACMRPITDETADDCTGYAEARGETRITECVQIKDLDAYLAAWNRREP